MKPPSDYNYCKKKRQYLDEEEALFFGNQWGYNNAYRCPKCRYWHLTHRARIDPHTNTISLFEKVDMELGIGIMGGE